jgi:hypothetical protein
MGLLSSLMGTGSDPSKSVIFTPGGRRPWRAASTAGFLTKEPEREEPDVKFEPEVNVDTPVPPEAIVPVSSSVMVLISARGVLGLARGLIIWYKWLGKVGL